MKHSVEQTPRRSNGEGRSGFTLVELMISVAVISILAGMAAQTFRAVLTAREIAINRLEKNETARTALGFLSSELRTAYITPDSVVPLEPDAQFTTSSPRFRFAGIYRDATTDNYPTIPGAGQDADGDGAEDEEILDGIDNDGDELIDEDLGLLPSDILHFVSAVENSGDIVLQEVSYGLDPSCTRLVRRGQVLSLSGGGGDLQNLGDFGQFIDNSSNQRLLPPIVPVGGAVAPQGVANAIENWDSGAASGRIGGDTPLANNNPAKIFEVLAYDVRGLRFRYWYYDYNRGGWRWTREWDSTRETALVAPSAAIFTRNAANNSIEGDNRVSFANLIVNEFDDMYPRTTIDPNQFLVQNIQQILVGDEFADTREKMLRRADGLPNMVEITIYVQDRKREAAPQPFTARVFIPNNYRSIGL